MATEKSDALVSGQGSMWASEDKLENETIVIGNWSSQIKAVVGEEIKAGNLLSFGDDGKVYRARSNSYRARV